MSLIIAELDLNNKDTRDAMSVNFVKILIIMPEIYSYFDNHGYNYLIFSIGLCLELYDHDNMGVLSLTAAI